MRRLCMLPAILILLTAAFPAGAGEEPAAEPPKPPDGSAPGPDPAAPPVEPKEGNGAAHKASERGEFQIGAGGSAVLEFADGTNMKVNANSQASVSREEKGKVLWTFLSLDAGVFAVKAEAGPQEYLMQGMNVLACGAEFQATVAKGPRTEIELVNKGGAALVVTDTLSDMQIRLEPGQGLTASVDPSGGKTRFKALPGNASDLVREKGGKRGTVAPGEGFDGESGMEAPGGGGLRAEIEGKVNVNPPTEVMEYRYTVDAGAGGKADFTFLDGSRSFVQEGASVALWSVKDKEGADRKTRVKLAKGCVKFDLMGGDFQLDTEVVAVVARGSVFSAEVGTDPEGRNFDEYRNLRGEQILVRSKKEGPSKDMAVRLKPGSGLVVRHGPGVPGVIFEIPKTSEDETVFQVGGKTLRMPAGGTLRFGDSGTTVTVTVPTPEAEFSATLPLADVVSAPSDTALQDSGDLIETRNVSP